MASKDHAVTADFTAAIERLLHARVRSLLAGDAEALGALLHPDFHYVDSLGRPLNRAAYLASRRSGEVTLLRHDLSDIEIREVVAERVALVTCVADDEGRFNGAPFQGRYRVVHLVACDGDQWLFLFGQSTTMA